MGVLDSIKKLNKEYKDNNLIILSDVKPPNLKKGKFSYKIIDNGFLRIKDKIIALYLFNSIRHAEKVADYFVAEPYH